MGSRLVCAPDTKHIDIIRVLVQLGSIFDIAKTQKSAIVKADCELLRGLFQTWGNMLPRHELGQLVEKMVKMKNTKILDLHVSYCVHDIDKVLNHGDSHETLLQIASRCAMIDFVLQKGASLHCPEPANNALTTLAKRLRCGTMDWDERWDWRPIGAKIYQIERQGFSSHT